MVPFNLCELYFRHVDIAPLGGIHCHGVQCFQLIYVQFNEGRYFLTDAICFLACYCGINKCFNFCLRACN